MATVFFDPLIGRFLEGVGFVYVGGASSSAEVSDTSVMSVRSLYSDFLVGYENEVATGWENDEAASLSSEGSGSPTRFENEVAANSSAEV